MPPTLNRNLRIGLFGGLLLLTAMPVITAPVALITGLSFSLLFGNPLPGQTSRAARALLKISVVGLGLGISLGEILEVGEDSLLLTMATITATICLGGALGKVLGIPVTTQRLISFGTAICGGSAIAALAPVIKAKDEEIAVSMATIFTLNAAALVLFPPLGRLLELNQRQFGLWAALAIHDTSSVVGAAAAFGTVALTIGTTVKLARALWIVPCTLITGVLYKSGGPVKIPFFILGFVAAAFLNSALPALDLLWSSLYATARQALVMTLFLIGAGLTRETLSQLGAKPLLLGILLWIIVSTATLGLILEGLIR